MIFAVQNTHCIPQIQGEVWWLLSVRVHVAVISQAYFQLLLLHDMTCCVHPEKVSIFDKRKLIHALEKDSNNFKLQLHLQLSSIVTKTSDRKKQNNQMTVCEHRLYKLSIIIKKSYPHYIAWIYIPVCKHIANEVSYKPRYNPITRLNRFLLQTVASGRKGSWWKHPVVNHGHTDAGGFISEEAHKQTWIMNTEQIGPKPCPRIS